MTERECSRLSELDEAALVAIARETRADWIAAARPSNTTIDVDAFAEKTLAGRWPVRPSPDVRRCFVLQCLLLDENLTPADHRDLREIAPTIRIAYRERPSAVYWHELDSIITTRYVDQPPERTSRLIAALNLYILLGV